MQYHACQPAEQSSIIQICIDVCLLITYSSATSASKCNDVLNEYELTLQVCRYVLQRTVSFVSTQDTVNDTNTGKVMFRYRYIKYNDRRQQLIINCRSSKYENNSITHQFSSLTSRSINVCKKYIKQQIKFSNASNNKNSTKWWNTMKHCQQ